MNRNIDDLPCESNTRDTKSSFHSLVVSATNVMAVIGVEVFFSLFRVVTFTKNIARHLRITRRKPYPVINGKQLNKRLVRFDAYMLQCLDEPIHCASYIDKIGYDPAQYPEHEYRNARR